MGGEEREVEGGTVYLFGSKERNNARDRRRRGPYEAQSQGKEAVRERGEKVGSPETPVLMSPQQNQKERGGASCRALSHNEKAARKVPRTVTNRRRPHR